MEFIITTNSGYECKTINIKETENRGIIDMFANIIKWMKNTYVPWSVYYKKKYFLINL